MASPAGANAFVVGSLDNNVYLCLADGSPIATMAGHSKGVVDLSWTGIGMQQGAVGVFVAVSYFA